MRIEIKTTVQQNIKSVWKQFDKNLLKKLSPPFPSAEIERFDGCSRGDEVHININFLLTHTKWISLITDHSITAKKIWFIDEGIKMPLGLTDWKHRHELTAIDKHTTEIADIIDFSTGNRLIDIALYPALYGQMLYRKPIYQYIFK